MIRRLVAGVALLSILLTGGSAQNRTNSPVPLKRPVGLVLSGGGARGAAMIGVFKELERRHIPIDYVVGTSAGAIFGGLWCAGYSSTELESLMAVFPWSQLLSDQPDRAYILPTQRDERERYLIKLRFRGLELAFPKGISGGQKLLDELTNLTARANYLCRGDFNRLHIPLRVVTTDVVNGRRIVLSSGNLGEAMRASMAAPPVFSPYQIDSLLLVDGGLMDPLPVDVAREVGCSTIIAIDCTAELQPREKLDNPLIYIDQATTIMSETERLTQEQQADLYIQPSLHGHLNSDFTNLDSLIEQGRLAAKYALERLTFPMRAFSAPQRLCVDTTLVRYGSWPAALTGNPLPEKPWRGTSDELDTLLRRALPPGSSFSWVLDSSTARTRLIVTAGSRDRFHFISAQSSCSIDRDTLQALVRQSVDSTGEGYSITATQKDSISATIRRFYLSKNYSLGHVESLWVDRDTLRLTFEEGVIRSIRITGNTRTDDFVILRNFPHKVGQAYSERQAAAGIRNIYATDLFEHVVHQLTANPSGGVDIELRVAEKPFYTVAAGLRYDLFNRFEGILDLADENVLGQGSRLRLGVIYGPRRQEYSTTFRADRFWMTHLTGFLTGYYNIRTLRVWTPSEVDHIIDRYGFRAGFGTQIRGWGMTTLEFMVEEVRVHDPHDIFHRRSLQLCNLWDTSDLSPFPRSGARNRLDLAFAPSFFAAQNPNTVTYNRLYGSLEFWIPLGDLVVLHPAVEGSFCGEPLMEDDKYCLTATWGFPGFLDRERVGEVILQGRLDQRWPIYGPFSLNASFATGNCWGAKVKLASQSLIIGSSLELWADTPLGPLKTGWGINTAEKWAWVLSWGHRF